jgi:sarcosine oxidase subunit beta
MARESIAVYRDLGGRLGTRLRPRFTACGYLFAAHAKQLADGRVLASDLQAAGDPVRDSEAWRRHVRNAVESLLPILVHAPLRDLVEGVYDVTPDGNAIVGAVPGLDGLWLAAGFSGHGFMMAPAVGRTLADAITGADQHQWLHALRFGRFHEGLTAREPHVI